MANRDDALSDLQRSLHELRNQLVTSASVDLVKELDKRGLFLDVDGTIPPLPERFMENLAVRSDLPLGFVEVASVVRFEPAPPAWLRDVPFFIPRRWRGRLLEEMYGDYVEMIGESHRPVFVWSAILSQILLMAISGAWSLLRDLIPSRGRG